MQEEVLKKSPEYEERLRRLFIARRKAAGVFLLALFAVGYYLWANYLSGRIVLIQEAGAEEITRGMLFGPIFLRAKSKTAFGYSVKLPGYGKSWEVRIEILDENLRTIYPETDLVLGGENTLKTLGSFAKKTGFKLKRGGKYFIRFTQLNGTYIANNGSNFVLPVIRFYVRSDIVDGWRLWLPIGIALVLALAVLVLF